MTFIRLISFTFLASFLLFACEENDYTEKPKTDIKSNDSTEIKIDSACITVFQAQANYKAGLNVAVWVKGYIVGAIKGTSLGNAQFQSPFTTVSNLLVADNINETNPRNCLPVQLPANSDVRKELNLADHPENMHKTIVISGHLTSYFTICGIKYIKSYYFATPSSVGDGQITIPLTETPQCIQGGR